MNRADPTRSRFVVTADNGEEAELVYDRDAVHLYLLRTAVPQARRGQGTGGALVLVAIAMAPRHDLVIVPWCPFARRRLDERADAAMGVAIDLASRPPRSGTGGQG
jgi:predicted GNAT family acetyltransferase